MSKLKQSQQEGMELAKDLDNLYKYVFYGFLCVLSYHLGGVIGYVLFNVVILILEFLIRWYEV